MKRLDIHPEHLIDRVLRGMASETERSELAAHVRACRACAAEELLGAALRERPAADLDGSSTSAAVDAALATLIGQGRLAPPLPSSSRPAPARARGWVPWAAGLCLFFTGSAAAATLIMAVRGADSGATVPAAAPAPAKHAGPRPARERVAMSAPATTEVQPDPTSSSAPITPTSSSAPAVVPQPRTRRMSLAAAAPSTTADAAHDAAELFAKARAAAMRGAFDESAALYTALQKRFSGSPQAHVSRVLLGRLYLEQLRDARAALGQFDAYLQEGGANRPEALRGRARALRALGRVQDEVEALRSLVDDYPESLYVAPAEERLRAVE